MQFYYIPGTCLSSILWFEPSKRRRFPLKTRFIWFPAACWHLASSCKGYFENSPDPWYARPWDLLRICCWTGLHRTDIGRCLGRLMFSLGRLTFSLQAVLTSTVLEMSWRRLTSELANSSSSFVFCYTNHILVFWAFHWCKSSQTPTNSGCPQFESPDAPFATHLSIQQCPSRGKSHRCLTKEHTLRGDTEHVANLERNHQRELRSTMYI